MSDNLEITPGTGATVATDEVAGAHHQLVKLEFGADGIATPVSAADPLPVTAPSDFPDAAALAKLEAIRILLGAASTESTLAALLTALQGQNPLTNAQLRANPVPVSGAFYPATQPVSLAASPLPAGAATENTLQAVRDRLPATPPAQALTDAQLRATPLPVSGPFYPATQAVSAAALPLPSGASTEATLAALLADFQGRIPALTAGGLRLAGYDPQDDMLKVKSIQKKFRDSFVGAALNADKWDSSVGAGASISLLNGTLVLGAGRTANAETWVLSRETFTIPFRVNIGLTLSQRIANQQFLVEAVSVDATGTPDGLHCVALIFDGVTATQARYRVQNSGATPLDSAAVTFPTTAANGFYELEPFADESWFHGGVLDASTGRANSYRRHQQIPEPNASFKIRLRWLNGASEPASATNATIQYISVQDYAELTAEITAGRGQSVAGQAVGVMVTNSISAQATIANAGMAVFTDSSTNLAANAVFTGTSRDAGPTFNLFVANVFADQSGTLVIQKSADNVTWRNAAAAAVVAGEPKELVLRVTTRYHRVVFTNGAAAQGAFLLTSAHQRI